MSTTISTIYSFKSGATYSSSEAPSNLVDGTTSNKMCITNFSSLGNFWVILVAGTPLVLSSTYQLWAAGDSVNDPKRHPKNFVIQGRNDLSNWTTLTRVTNLPAWTTNYGKYTYTLTNPSTSAFRFFRLNVTANYGDGNLQIGELVLTGDPPRVSKRYNSLLPRFTRDIGYIQAPAEEI